jgi:hypothetical protein
MYYCATVRIGPDQGACLPADAVRALRQGWVALLRNEPPPGIPEDELYQR